LGKTNSRNIIREVNDLDWIFFNRVKGRDYYTCNKCGDPTGVRKDNRKVHSCL
jgi:ribosomal protein S14